MKNPFSFSASAVGIYRFWVYITLFVVLGIFVQFLMHAGIEIWYIELLTSDFATYSLGFTWAQWFMIHTVGSIVLFFVGAMFGYVQGQYWWKRIYGGK